MDSSTEPTRPVRKTPLRWLAILVVLASLVFGLERASKAFAEIRDRERQVGELQALAERQERRGDFPAAWASLERASATAGGAGYLARLTGRPTRERNGVRAGQEDLAMAWLEHATASGGQTFAEIVDPLLPTIERAAAAATGRRKADLLAHLGWAQFLKSRDGTPAPDPVPFYRQAVAADAANPYAHAHWGHWLAWQRRPLAEAAAHFEAALASGRARSYVRQLQLSAFHLAGTPASDGAYLGAVADMVRNQEPVDAVVRDAVYSLYAAAFDDDDRFAALAAAVPPSAQIAVVRALFFTIDFEPSRALLRDACLARLQEADGDAAAALSTWRSIAAALPPGASGAVADRARAAVAATPRPLLR